MSLPLSRNTTYAATSPVKSNDLNDLQDMIMGGKRGSLVEELGFAGVLENHSGASQTPSGIRVQLNGTTGDAWRFCLRAPVGTRITALGLALVDSATGPTKLQTNLYAAAAGALTNPPGGAVGGLSAGSGSAQIVALTGAGLPLIFLANTYYLIEIVRSTGTQVCLVERLTVVSDKP